MNKFWKWMEKKKYAEYDDRTKDYDIFTDKDWIMSPHPKQMPIGYMIEYLLDNEFVDTYDILSECFAEKIQDMYEYLEDKIKDNK